MKTGIRVASKEAVTQTVSKAGQKVVKTGFREVPGKVVTQTVSKPAVGLASPLVAGALCAAAFEGVHITFDLYSAHADMRAGKMDKNEFITATEKRLMTGAGNVGGSTLGTAIGQVLIPIPFVGAAVGAVVGGMTGTFIGNMVANSLLCKTGLPRTSKQARNIVAIHCRSRPIK